VAAGNKFASICAQIEQLLPRDRVIADFRREVFSVRDQVQIELEKRTIVVNKSVQIDVIAYVIQHGLIGESSDFRVTIGLGGIEFVPQVNVPELCWVTMHYTQDLVLSSVHFYEQM
jgi:hypothetical protein